MGAGASGDVSIDYNSEKENKEMPRNVIANYYRDIPFDKITKDLSEARQFMHTFPDRINEKSSVVLVVTMEPISVLSIGTSPSLVQPASTDLFREIEESIFIFEKYTRLLKEI